jgi:hypothetical protein
MRHTALRLVGYFGALLFSQLALAQNPAPQTNQTTTNPPPANLAGVRVSDAYRTGQWKSKDKEVRATALGDTLIIKVTNLQALSDQSKCRDRTGKSIADCHAQEISLFLDGRKIKGLVPESGAPKEGEGTLQFRLDRSPDSDETWADLLGNPPLSPEFWFRPTEVSVGLENDYPVPTDVVKGKFYLRRVRQIFFWPCLLIFLFLLGALAWLAKNSDIVRDSGPVPAGSFKPFSLARCQMAFWFVIVVGSFLFIWLITGASDIITPGALALIGIASGTALGAAVIDIGKQQSSSSQLTDLITEQTALQAEVANLDTQIGANPPPANLAELQQTRATKKARLDTVTAQVTAAQARTTPQKSEGFLRDILTDATGISFHRFQMFIWTFVLAVLFAYGVWTRLSMPTLSATLLALQGISAGTYLGFKIPETQAT